MKETRTSSHRGERSADRCEAAPPPGGTCGRGEPGGRSGGWARIGFLVFALLASRMSAAEADTTPTLDEITIEGEIAMPQVLFITAREPFRYMDTHHRSYLSDAVTHANWIPFPTSLWIVGHERPSTLGAPRGPEDQG